MSELEHKLDEIQDAILAHLKGMTIAKVEEHAIPDLAAVPRSDNGDVVPYVAIQFGDIIASSSGTGFAGPLFDDYQMPIYIQVVASDTRESRRLANFITGRFLGSDFPFSGSVRKRMGGAQFPMEGTDGSIEAYIWPLSFTVLVQAAVAVLN